MAAISRSVVWILLVILAQSFVICAHPAEKRSDDAYTQIVTVVEQLTSRVTALEASKTALTNQVTVLEADKTALTNQVTALQAGKTALENRVAGLESRTSRIKCESGTISFDPHHQSTNGAAQRIHTQHITFNPPFAGTPVISTGLIHLDSINSRSDDRVDVSVSGATSTGFNLAVMEWADTFNNGVGVSWMACLVG